MLESATRTGSLVPRPSDVVAIARASPCVPSRIAEIAVRIPQLRQTMRLSGHGLLPLPVTLGLLCRHAKPVLRV